MITKLWRRLAVTAEASALLAAFAVAPAGTTASAATSGQRVLLVGTYQGHAGTYRTIQAAVDAAKPGDWILIGPGDYHENADLSGHTSNVDQGGYGGVLITTPGLHLRGMNRNTVIVDGTNAGSSACSSNPSDQNLGASSGGKQLGRNGIVVYRSHGVSIDNLTVCNFLGGSGDSGNQIWWNGGAGTGQVGLFGYEGSYLTATSTYFGGEATAATYGIFSGNSSGGSWDQIYASNFNDSGMYVGACKQACNMAIDHAWMEYNPLGYSGTNSGGRIVIEHSQFDNNQDGFDTNTQINGDPPAPQNGACPHNGTSAITHTHSCWVFLHNYVHDNNNPDVPSAGEASNGPTGTGMTVSGGRNDTVMDNVFADNGAWGVLFIPYPDGNTPSLGQSCSKTGGVQTSGLGCVYDPQGDALLDNTFHHNGFFGNPSNADYGQLAIDSGQPRNCYARNNAPNGSVPSDLEESQPTCGPLTSKANAPPSLLGQVLCDTQVGACPAGAQYPQHSDVVMHPLPKLATMPNPCKGVPSNAWCPSGG